MSAPATKRAPWLIERAQRTPERTAVEWLGGAVSFEQLAERTLRRASALQDRGVRRSDRVAALLPNGLDFVELFHAVDALGATLVPLNARLTVPELRFQLADAEPRILTQGTDAAGERAREAAARTGIPSVPIEALRSEGAPALETTPEETPVALLYTSGTTGEPKGALLSRRAMAASARASSEHLGTGPEDRWLACLPLYHVGGLSLLVRSALDGSPLVVHERFDASAVAARLAAGDVSGISLVPTQLERLLDTTRDRTAPAPLRIVLLGGAPVSTALEARAAAAGYPIAPTYGLTEASSQVATRTPGSARSGLTPLPGIALRILDEAGHPCAAADVGEIAVHGATVMSGYWRREPATCAVLRDGWLRAGDAGWLDAEGDLHVVDRRRDLIVSGGENVYPAEIERVLAGHPGVEEAAVRGVADAAFGERPVAWIVPRGEGVDATGLIAHCRNELAGYKIPIRFHAVESLPRNALGKLLRRALEEPSASEGAG